MRVTTAACIALLLALTTLPPAAAQTPPPTAEGRYQEHGDVGGFANIMPPGAHGVLNAVELVQALGGTFPPHYNDQTAMYDGLLDEAGLPGPGGHGEGVLGVTDGDLARWFKDGSFGTDEAITPIDTSGCPAGVVAFRDGEFGVPHIYGETREAALCAVGYATAEDRLFLMDVLRHTGRARMSELLGASAANRAMDREQLLVAPYTEEELTAQVTALCEDGAEGARLCADADAYLTGVNAHITAAITDPTLLPGEYPALQLLPEPFVREDIVAIASLVGGIFGKGGGGEAANSLFLAALEEVHGPEEARRIFDDLKGADDADTPTTTTIEFPYLQHDAIDPSSTVLLEPGSFQPALTADSAGNPLTDLLEGLVPGLPGLPELPGLPGLPGAGAVGGRTSLGIVDGPLGPIDLRGSLGMSNAILAGADVTDGEVPIAVFGPQTGYYTPQLLVEQDVHAPGYDARGVAFAGTNLYVQLGRGRDYAWSATSASGDLVDEWALELCDPAGGEATLEATGYRWDGECRPIDVLEHTQIAKPTLGGIPEPDADAIVFTMAIGRVPDLDGAPIVGRALTTDGVPVAIAEQRSTYGAELDSAIGFARINDPEFMADGVDAFRRAFAEVDFTFNWFYADTTDIAYQHSCRCPLRDERTDPDLLTWAGRGYEWTGELLPHDRQPWEVNPESGFFANWNNKQAPGWRTNDDQWSWHSTHRRQLLAERMDAAVASGVPLTRGDMVNIMEDAATVDLNAQELYPLALAVMGSTPPAGLGDAERLTRMRELLQVWVDTGGHRRDLDGDGVYDHATAVAIGDAWLRPLVDAVVGDELATPSGGSAPWPGPVEDHPRQGLGSAYNAGHGIVVHEELLAVLGREVAEPRSRRYCADGTLAGCAEVLWASLADAAALLESAPDGGQGCDFPSAYQFGTPDPEGWVYRADCDDIIQVAGGVVSAPPMRWVNRPTFQQVVQAGTITGRIGGLDRTATAARLSRHAFPDGAGVVVIAAAGTFADAVAGTPLAAALHAPLLLTAPDGLAPVTAAEIARLGATEAVVLGGPVAVGEEVVAELGELGLEVRRVAGDTRYATAAAIAAEVGTSDRVVLASGVAFPDALAAGPFAVADDRAVLLTEPDTLPGVVADLLGEGADVVIAGGTAAIGAAVEEALDAAGAAVDRIGGPDRYATAHALAVAAAAAGQPTDTAYVVTGERFPDALAAAATAGHVGASLVLVNPAGLDVTPDARDLLAQVGAAGPAMVRIWFVGGEAAIPSSVRAAVERLV